MKKYIAVITMLIGLAFTACAHQKKAGSKKPKAGSGKAPKITALTIVRGACFGRCPMYTLSINSNGQALYEGRSFTEYTGTYQKKFTPAEVAPLFAQAAELRIDTCKGNYEVMIPDLPGLDVKMTVNGREKELRNAGFGPRFLHNLGEDIDKAIKVDGSWKKIKDLPKAQ